MAQLHAEDRVAHHEAGHAVIAFRLGARLDEMNIEGKQTPQGTWEWTGEVTRDDQQLCREKVARIAFAGALAEVKHTLSDGIAQKHGLDLQDVLQEVRLSDESLDRVLTALLELPDKDSCSDGGVAEVAGTIDGIEHHARVHLWESEEDIKPIASVFPGLPRDALYEHIRRARDLIDDPANWRAIIALAKRTMEVPPQPVKRKYLEGWHVEGIVNRALNGNTL